MSTLFKNRPWIFALIVTVFFLCARAGSVAHAASYGSAPHNHDGKICVLSVLANEDDELDDQALPPEEFSLEQPIFSHAVFNDYVVNYIPTISVCASARSPPAR